MSKNKFTNAFASALSKTVEPEIVITKRPEVQTSESPEVQTSKRPNVHKSENLNLEKSSFQAKISPIESNEVLIIPPTTTKKPSLKDLGWQQTTIYLPPETKRKLQMRSVKEGRDMSEIVAEVLGI